MIKETIDKRYKKGVKWHILELPAIILSMKVALQVHSSIRSSCCSLLESRGYFITENNPDLIIREKSITQSPEVKTPVLILETERLNQLTDLIDKLEIFHLQREQIKNKNRCFLLCREESYELLDAEKAYFFDAQGDQVFCESPKGRWEVKMKLYEIADRYRSRGFIRISKSTVVNILSISEIVPWFSGKLLLRFHQTEEIREVSRRYTSNFKSFIGIKR